MTLPQYVKTPWPEDNVPIGEPAWFFYEIDVAADAVTRSVWVYADGLVTRNSIEIEERSGKSCLSLIDCSLVQGFEGAALEMITPAEFQWAWERGIDTPFWNVA